MMFANNFVLAILDESGRPVREIDGRAVLPFNKHYKVRLKNKNDRRAQVDLTIDGTSLFSDDRRLVLDPNKTSDIERFVTESDTQGKKFLFVSIQDGRVQDPTSNENGVIRAEFWSEKKVEPQPVYIHHHYRCQCWRCRTPKIHPYDIRWNQNPGYSTEDNYEGINTRYASRGGLSCGSLATSHQGSPAGTYTASIPGLDGSAGATVGGETSWQSFTTVSGFNLESFSTVLSVKLVGVGDKEAAISGAGYCSQCGKKRDVRGNFCSGCGFNFPGIRYRGV